MREYLCFSWAGKKSRLEFINHLLVLTKLRDHSQGGFRDEKKGLLTERGGPRIILIGFQVAYL